MDCGRGYAGSDLTLIMIPFSSTDNRARLVAEVSRSKKFSGIGEPNGEDFQSMFKEFGIEDVRVSECLWSSTFNVHEQLADHFCINGRIMLMGDAAHAHSPAGGMGMNTGIQDACNLVW